MLAAATLGLGAGGAPLPARQLVAALLLAAWGLRLSGFLLFRILKTGHDARFDGMRDRLLPFFGFWVFQMLWVWVVSLPVTVLASPAVRAYPQRPFGTARDIAGLVLFAVGFVLEAASDVQKYRFRARSGGGNAFCHTGFFAVSRHPHYFGDILVQFCAWSPPFLLST